MSDATVAAKLAEGLERVIVNFDIPTHVVSRISMLIRDTQDIRFIDGAIVPEDDFRRGTAVVFTRSLIIFTEWQDPVRNRPNLTHLTINTWPRQTLAEISFTTNTKDRVNLIADWNDGPISDWPWSTQAILRYKSPDRNILFPLRPGSKIDIHKEIGEFFPTLIEDLTS